MTSDPKESTTPRSCEWTQDAINHLENDFRIIESILKVKLETLEKVVPLQGDAPEEESPLVDTPLSHITERIISALKLHTRAEETVVKENDDLKKQIRDQQYLLEEIEMERDVLLQQVHAYLETNSSLKVRLEEQRCQTGALQRQLNADLESRIRSLENDKEELADLNLEKDKEIHKMAVMLEQMTKCLKNRETEVLNRRNEENNLISSLRTDLRRALDEKANMEEKYTYLKDSLARKKNRLLKKSLSVGDISKTNVNFLEKNILLEPALGTGQNGQNPEDRSLALHSSLSWPTERMKNPPVHTQLSTLRRELYNVTKKLEALKSQLITSGVIPEDPKPVETRPLKRKANPMEESEQDDQKSEFKNLKNILQDAKDLNVKLQNLREQKLIEMNRKEAGVQVTENKNDEFSQTAHESGPRKETCKTR